MQVSIHSSASVDSESYAIWLAVAQAKGKSNEHLGGLVTIRCPKSGWFQKAVGHCGSHGIR